MLRNVLQEYFMSLAYLCALIMLTLYPANELQLIKKLVRQRPESYVDEIQEWMDHIKGRKPPLSSLQRLWKKMGWSRKKGKDLEDLLWLKMLAFYISSIWIFLVSIFYQLINYSDLKLVHLPMIFNNLPMIDFFLITHSTSGCGLPAMPPRFATAFFTDCSGLKFIL